MREWYVYELRAGDWLYIGQSSDPKQRLANHRSMVRHGRKAKHWDEALCEYPDPHQWSMEVVAGPYDTEEEAMIEEARRQDEHWEMPGRLWRNKGAKLGPEVVECHRERMQGEGNPQYGKPISEETKAKLRAVTGGENNAMYGKPGPNLGKEFSDEHKRRIGDAMKEAWARRKAQQALEHSTQ